MVRQAVRLWHVTTRGFLGSGLGSGLGLIVTVACIAFFVVITAWTPLTRV